MTTIGRTTVVGQPDVLLQKVVMTELDPLTLQGKIFFKKYNAFNADTTDIFGATIHDILEDTPKVKEVIKIETQMKRAQEDITKTKKKERSAL